MTKLDALPEFLAQFAPDHRDAIVAALLEPHADGVAAIAAADDAGTPCTPAAVVFGPGRAIAAAGDLVAAFAGGPARPTSYYEKPRLPGPR